MVPSPRIAGSDHLPKSFRALASATGAEHREFVGSVYENSSPMKATWNNTTLAESDDTVVVEGNHYFPASSLRREYFRDSATHTTCGWKGEASYYDVEVADQRNKDAAWYYPEPKDAAANIKDHVAFWKGVVVS